MMEHPNAEGCVPEIPSADPASKESEVVREMKKITVLRILRPDRFIAAVKMFVAKVLGEMNSGEIDLMKIVEKETNAKSPLLLVSAPGFDASYKVD